MRLLRKFWRKWRDDQSSRQGAALAFYGLFTLAPVMVLLSQATGLLDGWILLDTASPAMDSLIPETLIPATKELTASTQRISGSSYLVTIALLFYSPFRGFLHLQATLNSMWGIRAIRQPGAKGVVIRKLLAYGTVGTTLLLMFAALLTDAVLQLGLPGGALMHFFTRFALLFSLIAALFWSLPDAKVGWRPLATGALFSASVLLTSRSLISLYLEGSTRIAVFGPAGTVVGLLVFAYISAQILLAGAVVVYIAAEEWDQPIQPGRHAVGITVVRQPNDAV